MCHKNITKQWQQNSLWHLWWIFSWKMTDFQPTLTLSRMKGKPSANKNEREKFKPFCVYIWIRVNFISILFSWDDLFPLGLSLCFWMGWQVSDSSADSSVSCRKRTGEHRIAPPLDNELGFWMQPRFLQDKPQCDRLVVDEATHPEDFLYQGLLLVYLLYIVQRRQKKSSGLSLTKAVTCTRHPR